MAHVVPTPLQDGEAQKERVQLPRTLVAALGRHILLTPERDVGVCRLSTPAQDFIRGLAYVRHGR